MSYHQGYEWNDGIESGVEETLKGRCELQKFHMDTKRNTSANFAREKAEQVKKIITNYKPDIVIAADDNAVKYVVTEYENSDIPFVFCGVNWSAKRYGFPYDNVVGMVEVAPISSLLRLARETAGNMRTGIFLTSDTRTEHKDFSRIKKVYSREGVKLTALFAKTMQEWNTLYSKAQKADFIILNNNAGIVDWSEASAVNTVKTKTKKLTLTTYKWMMPYAMVGIAKKPSEQGIWAAKTALKVLSGTPIKKIPVAINKQWSLYVNNNLLKKANLTLSPETREKASINW